MTQPKLLKVDEKSIRNPPRTPADRPLLPPTMLEVSLVSDIGQLLPLASTWEGLSRVGPYQCFAWQRAWLETLGRNLKIRVLVARYGDFVVGILPLVQRTRTLTGTTLEFVGSVPGCTSNMGLLVKPTHEQRVAEAFAEYLFDDCPFAFSQLELTGISLDAPAMREFSEQIRRRTSVHFEAVRAEDGWLFRVQAGPDGTHIWPMCLRNASHAARKAYHGGAFTFDPGLSDPVSGESVQQKNLVLLGYLNNTESRVVEDQPRRDGASDFFLNHFAGVLQEASSTRALPNRLSVPILRWQSKPIAGAVAIAHGGTLYVYRIDVATSQPAQTCHWLLLWAMVQDAARSGIRHLVFGANLREQIQDLRCMATPVDHWKVTMPGLSSRVRKAVIESTNGLRFGSRNRTPRSFADGPLTNSRP